MTPAPLSHGETEYATYLLVDDLLSLQRPLTPGAHDEMLFIVIHQVFELWFKLLLHELTATRDRLRAADPAAAQAALVRCCRIDEVLIGQLAVLETMSPDGFLSFRDPLAPASGFQSRQFRAIEAICGGGDDDAIWPAFCACATALDLPMPQGGGPAARRHRLAALAGLYTAREEPRRAALHGVAELLLDHDEAVARWRFRHTLMAAREIGERPGTGGSAGVGYLRSTLDKRFFPELWAVRSQL
ncbi:MAG TPA: tryptophan 2,3-dioxygenase family protein [Candidatus Dormibacteraeota bacterium]